MRSLALRATTGAVAVVAALGTMTGAAVADDPKPAAPAGVASLSSTPYVTITSSGPIGQIHLGNELSCQVNVTQLAPNVASTTLVGFGTGGQMYGPSHQPADCGTFLSYAGMLYGPDFASHGGSATPFWGGPTYLAFTPVSQTAPSGSGTLTDPYVVTTVVDAGSSGIRLTRIDTYVTGRTHYRSDVVVTNTTAVQKNGLRLYHGLDCYLAGNDVGNGSSFTWPTTATSRVGCTGANRTMQLVGVTAGNGYYEDGYWAVWDRINNRLALPNTVNPALVDNGIAIDWGFSLPPYGSVIRSFLTEFVSSPVIIAWPVDRLPVEAALIVREGDPMPTGAGVSVRVSAAGQDQAFDVFVPIGS